jgi:hypothetical protein
MFFAAPLHGIFHHTFTTIYPSFTTQNTTFCAPKFAKNPRKNAKSPHTKKYGKLIACK